MLKIMRLTSNKYFATYVPGYTIGSIARKFVCFTFHNQCVALGRNVCMLVAMILLIFRIVL